MRCLSKPATRDGLRIALEELLGGAGSADTPPPQREDITAGGDGPRVRDPDKALAIAGGRRELAERMLGEFLRELPETLARIETDLRTADWPRLAETLHKLRGGAACCGALALIGITEQLERRVKEQRPPSPATVAAFFAAAEQFIRACAAKGMGSTPTNRGNPGA